MCFAITAGVSGTLALILLFLKSLIFTLLFLTHCMRLLMRKSGSQGSNCLVCPDSEIPLAQPTSGKNLICSEEDATILPKDTTSIFTIVCLIGFIVNGLSLAL